MRRPVLSCVLAGLLLPGALFAQQEKHGRGYKPPPATATVVVNVEKALNGKPFPNASVIFRAMRDEATDANLEMKTDTEGQAKIDLLEVGDHVTVQVIADGFATYATDFDLTADGHSVLVKLQRPRQQVSVYSDHSDQPANVQPGVQEHHVAAPTAVAPTAVSPTGPLQTTPPAATPSNTPGAAPAATPGSPQ